MNKVFLIGNLTKDPELSATANGISLCKFSIAVNRNYVNANNEREVDFFNITAWRGLGETCGKYLSKGKKVAICGSIQLRSYEDKDGIKRISCDIQADDVEFLTPKSESSSSGKSDVSELKPIESDDLPFF